MSEKTEDTAPIQKPASPFQRAVQDLASANEVVAATKNKYNQADQDPAVTSMEPRIAKISRKLEAAEKRRDRLESLLGGLEEKQNRVKWLIRDKINEGAIEPIRNLVAPHLENIRRLLEIAHPAGEFGEWKIDAKNNKIVFETPLPQNLKGEDRAGLLRNDRWAIIHEIESGLQEMGIRKDNGGGAVRGGHDDQKITITIDPKYIDLPKLFDATANKLFESKYFKAPTDSTADKENMRRIREGLEANFKTASR